MIQACMFDMGGVVDEFSSETMERKLLRDFGVTHVDSFISLCPGLQKVLQDLTCGLVDEKQFWLLFQEMTGVRIPDEPRLYTKYFTPVRKTDTLQVISDLKSNGVRVVAGTNVEPPHRLWHEQRNDYAIFDMTYTSDALHLAKPDPAFFIEIAKRENLKPEEFFFTDDRLDNVEAARSVGMHGYQFHSAQELRAKLQALALL